MQHSIVWGCGKGAKKFNVLREKLHPKMCLGSQRLSIALCIIGFYMHYVIHKAQSLDKYLQLQLVT